MEKMKEIIIASSIVLGVAAISVVGYFLVKHFIKDNTFDGDGMINDRCLSCTYNLSGGMEGNSLSITLKETELETATLEVVSSNGPDDEETTENYTVSFDALEKIYQIFKKYEVTKWGELPTSEIQALDAPIVTICIETVDKTVSFDSTKEFPKDAYSIISEIRSVLDECIEQAKSSEQSTAAE
ncbi:MAG: hypothetical protein ACI4JI_03190 [Ruminiclostridium sp.]